MIKTQKEKNLSSSRYFPNCWKDHNDPYKKLQVSFSCQDWAIITLAVLSQRNKKHCRCWRGLTYSLGFLLIVRVHIHVLRTHPLTFSHLLMQDASNYTIQLHHSFNLQIQKCSQSTSSCNSDYVNSSSSEKELLHYEMASPKNPLASGQIPLHKLWTSLNRRASICIQNTSVSGAAKHFWASYVKFNLLPHPLFLKSSLFLCIFLLFNICNLFS